MKIVVLNGEEAIAWTLTNLALVFRGSFFVVTSDQSSYSEMRSKKFERVSFSVAVSSFTKTRSVNKAKPWFLTEARAPRAEYHIMIRVNLMAALYLLSLSAESLQ